MFQQLEEFANRKCIRLFMPGHKGKLPLSASWDVTELYCTDDLSSPNGMIKQAEQNFAQLFGAKQAFFCVNGSTLGNLTLLKTASDTLLITRNSHLSVFNGLELFGKTAYVYNDNFGQNRITASDVETILSQHKEIGTVFLTSPDYYGNCVELDKIYRITQQKGVLLFVDSAHGAHFGLSPTLLPKSTVTACDACVVSTHKTLPALTQTSVILVNNAQLSQRIKDNLNMMQTTSPSFLLSGSIDYAREYCDKHKDYYVKLKRCVDKLRDSLPECITLQDNDDFTRLVFDFTKKQISGKTAYDFLARHNVVAEFYDQNRVVGIVTLNTTQSDIKRLQIALKELANEQFPVEKVDKLNLPEIDNTVKVCFNYKGETEYVNLNEAVGRICAKEVGVTPPCVPVILKGQVVEQASVDYLSRFSQLFGVKNGKIAVLKDIE